jgi:OOP family OmpA-OmpF porin
VPTGSPSNFTSDGTVRGMPELFLSGEAGVIAYAVHAGVMIRAEQQVLESTVGDEMSAGAALGFLLVKKKLQIGPEIYGTTTFKDPFAKDSSNFEGIAGARFRAGVWVFGAGAGPGFTRGLGTPAARVVASFAYAPEPEEKEEPSDRDHDRVLDLDDACPDTPGIRTDDIKTNGCPDGDGDHEID